MLTMVVYKSRSIVMSLVVFLGFSMSAHAHEFWLEPLAFQVEKGANIQAHIKVGEGLDGDTYGFFAAKFDRFDLTVDGNTKPLKDRFAQKPAVEQPTDSEGLHILTHQSKFSRLNYKKREIFEKFVRAEGIDWVLDAHEERGLHPLDFLELYQRFAKSLVKVGEGSGQDQLMGMPFEWVVLTNPYGQPKLKTVTAQLFFQKKPFADSVVNLFIKHDDKIKKMQLKTNGGGKIDVPVGDGGVFLINAVHMVEPSKALAESTGAAWLSLWASTTFLIE